ncbi:MAG: cell division protein ZipA C-terminal FtsZ-binding domain-containing protein [Granulosicoccaceae bacterium]
MIETLSWLLIGGGLAVLLMSYGRYFFGGRRIKGDAQQDRQGAELIDLNSTVSNRSLDQEMLEQALHSRSSENTRPESARLPAELDPIFDDLSPGVQVENGEQYAETVREEMEPQLDANLFDEDDAEEILSPSSYASDRELTSLNVMAKPGRVLSGAALKGQFLGRSFEHGEMRIFHSRFNQQTLFSVVNTVEPGYFDIDNMDSMTTPGVSFFLQLPGPLRDDVAFDMMLSEAHELAQALDAELRDENHAPLTRNALEETRARLIRSANARYGTHDHVS